MIQPRRGNSLGYVLPDRRLREGARPSRWRRCRRFFPAFHRRFREAVFQLDKQALRRLDSVEDCKRGGARRIRRKNPAGQFLEVSLDVVARQFVNLLAFLRVFRLEGFHRDERHIAARQNLDRLTSLSN